MADIRINSLPTTASASSSDDFLALDGATNGTRKLNAYSPTFGGNATVGGAIIGSSSETKIQSSSTAARIRISGGTENDGAGVIIGGSTDGGIPNTGILAMAGATIASWSSTAFNTASGKNLGVGGNLTVSGGTATFQDPTNSYRVTLTTAAAKSVLATSFGGSSLALRTNGSATDALLIDSSLNTTISGNLTVSGTGIQQLGGNGALVKLGVPTNAPNTNLVGNLLQVKTGSGIAYITIGNGDSANSTAYVGGASGFTLFGTVTDAGVLTESARIPTTGNLLIGTTTDGGQKLQVNGTGRFFGAVGNSNGSGFVSYGPNGTDTGARIWCFSDGAAYIDAGATTGTDAGKLFLRTGSSLNTALTLDSSQNATFAGATVNVSKAGNNPAFKATDGSIITKLQSQSVGDTAGSIGTESNHALKLVTNNTTALTISASQAATFAGVANHPDGSTAAPSIAFTADPDTGFARAATNILEAVAGGVRVATFRSTFLDIPLSTASTSTSTGALVVSGGVGVAGAANVGTYYGMVDGVTAPGATAGYAKIYVDTADGDLKVIFGDGTIKTIATDT